MGLQKLNIKLILKTTTNILLLICLLFPVQQAKAQSQTIDEKLDFCYKVHLEDIRRTNKLRLNPVICENVYSAFENFLLNDASGKAVLRGVDKQAYTNLIMNLDSIEAINTLRSEIVKAYNTVDLQKDLFRIRSDSKNSFFDVFFNSEEGYRVDIECYEYLIKDLKLISEDDFQYNIYVLISIVENQGRRFSANDMLQLLEIIPDSEFGKILYRRILIKEIYCKVLDI